MHFLLMTLEKCVLFFFILNFVKHDKPIPFDNRIDRPMSRKAIMAKYPMLIKMWETQ